MQAFLMHPLPIPISPSPPASTTEDSTSTPSTSPDLYDVPFKSGITSESDSSAPAGEGSGGRPRSCSESRIFPTPSGSYFVPEETAEAVVTGGQVISKQNKRRSSSIGALVDMVTISAGNGLMSDMVGGSSSGSAFSSYGSRGSTSSSLTTNTSSIDSELTPPLSHTQSATKSPTSPEDVNGTPTSARPLSDSAQSASSGRTSLPPPSRPASSYLPFLTSSTSSRISSSRRFSDRLSLQNANIKIRDFGFPSTDPRHHGERVGAPATEGREGEKDGDWWPAPLRSNSNNSTSLSLDEEDEDDDDDGEFEEFRKWRESAQDEPDAEPEPAPAVVDVGPGAGGCVIKLGMVYRAAYDFEAEGDSELSLEKGDLLKVLELICEGWVVAERIYEDESSANPPQSGEADAGLVPANYLEVV
ncbi:hypothetical protein BT69DRAFT_466153 [Atractiella rhizophila]|nr:hypothetical protein BT69DRAFT_466153 [Atractiella rhizophila]